MQITTRLASPAKPAHLSAHRRQREQQRQGSHQLEFHFVKLLMALNLRVSDLNTWRYNLLCERLNT